MSAPIALETAALLGLRASFYLLARRYLQRTLFSDLRQVIHEETSTSSPTSTGGHESPDEFPLSPSTSGTTSLRDQLYNLRGAANSSSSILPVTNRAGSTTPTNSRSRANSGNNHGKSAASQATGKGVAPKLAGAIFCLSVSECSTLFALILFGGAVSLKYV